MKLLLAFALLQAAEPPPAATASTVQVEVAYLAWMTSLDFEAATPTEAIMLEGSTLQGVEIAARYPFAEGWSARLAIDLLSGLDMQATGITLGATHDFDFMDLPWRPFARAALVAGSLDVKDVPGSFGTAVGFEAAVGLSRDLPEVVEGLAVRAELGLRHQSFAFDEDADVVTADDGMGGFGLLFAAGAEWRF